jgi:hypothetical protein
MPATFDTVRKICSTIEGAEESTSYKTPAFKMGGSLFARQNEEPDWLVVRTTFEERDELMASDYDTYFITDHYLKYPWVLVSMSRIHRDALGDLLRRAARLAAAEKRPKKPARRKKLST